MENLSNYFGRNIKDKRILITGGTTGIGKAIADLLVSLEARVFIFGRDIEDFTKTFDEIKSKYPNSRLHGFTADVTKKEDLKKVFEVVDKEFGGLDILINNAALPASALMKVQQDDLQYILDTNISGYLAFAQEAVSRMSAEKSGHIINIGSMSAETNEPTSTVYVATKAAIRGFSSALRKEVNSMGIKVSLIEPGAVTSDMQPGTKAEHQEKIDKMEMLEAEDIAMSVLFTLSQPKRCDIVTMQIRPLLQLI